MDLSRILQRQADPEAPRRSRRPQEHGLERVLDLELIARAAEALREGTAVELELPIRNTNRTVGTMLGYEVTKRYGAAGLPEDTIRVHFSGSAGQSFGAFLPRGVTLRLEGDANDHFGKGLSGGKLVVFPPRQATFDAESNVIIGNVVLYGATSGEAYVRGIAGERFAVRNSGASAVVEGVGDHACEYMTGGCVVVLGGTGRNFAAGMSGGIAYVLDEDGHFRSRCNPAMVDIEPLGMSGAEDLIEALVSRHLRYTGSPVAARVLAGWELMRHRFLRVSARDYKRALAAQRAAEPVMSREPAIVQLEELASG